MRERGLVLSWNAAEGQGVVQSTESSDELFVHFSALMPAGGFRALSPGQTVEFQRARQPGPSGEQWVAFAVRVVSTTRPKTDALLG
jgi:cold shock CspA family protein